MKRLYAGTFYGSYTLNADDWDRFLVVLQMLYSCDVGQDSSVGIATCYGLDGPGIESPIHWWTMVLVTCVDKPVWNRMSAVVKRSKARVCGRSLAGVVGSDPAGGMDVCVVLWVKTKTQNAGQSRQRNKVRIKQTKKYTRTQKLSGGETFRTRPDQSRGPIKPPIQWVPAAEWR